MKKLYIFLFTILFAMLFALIQPIAIGFNSALIAPHFDDPTQYVYSKDTTDQILLSEKNEIVSKANALISNNSYIEAQKVLNESMFKNDQEINRLQQMVEQKIKALGYKEYDGQIDILAFEPIISFPEILKKSSPSVTKTEENHITINEFEKILLSLFENNYVLINSKNIKSPLLLPSGKKPIILIMTDVTYNTKNGTVDKLILDDYNNIVTYTPKRSINDRIHHSNDFITALEQFVKDRPTFSPYGAKGIITIDGSSGILGYKTQKTNANSKFQIKKCHEITNNLKENGWEFACKGYKYGSNENNVNFSSGLSHWTEFVEPIVGDTTIYLLSPDSQLDDYKSGLLASYNYSTILGESNEIFSYNLISGKTLRQEHENLLKFFDTDKVYDHLYRPIFI